MKQLHLTISQNIRNI